jgi:fibro-slime domain-containing protein
MVWVHSGSPSTRGPRVAVAALLLGALVHCSGSKKAADDDDDYRGEGGEGVATGGKAGGGGSSASAGKGASGGKGGSAGGSSGGKSGTTGGSGGSTAGETGDAGMGGAPPGCGDGSTEGNEECDDGNTTSGDGCSAICTNESTCAMDDAECMPVCGDGVLTPPERCDDRNTVAMDGCNESCSQIEVGYSCPTPGELCTQGVACGNGALETGEGCDDGNTVAMDGCSATCGMEDGYGCSGSPSLCVPVTCGNMTVEGTEGCDDGNAVPLDGCSTDCQIEPGCDMNGCTSPCGDGIVVSEACDDGNTQSGDGCSATCTVESGYMCSAAACDRLGGHCVLRVPAVFRDFNASTLANGHPDFSPGFNSTGALQGLLLPDLDAEGKPQLAAPSTPGFLHSAGAFAEWYRDTPGVNATVPGEIVLWEDGAGGYVNRWGASGERWRAETQYLNALYGGPAGGGCTVCTPQGGESCVDPCPLFSNTYSCCATVSTMDYDGNPLFFPIDTAPGILTEAHLEAKVPEAYGFLGWPWEDDVAVRLGVVTPVPTATSPFPTALHNFHFTTEVRFFFRYEVGRQITLNFTGDDDLWVFLNGKLAVDLGAWHVPLNGGLMLWGDTDETIDTTETLTETGSPVETRRNAAYYGLVPGQLTSIAVFHAERQREGSSFKLGIRGLDVGKSVCVK